MISTTQGGAVFANGRLDGNSAGTHKKLRDRTFLAHDKRIDDNNVEVPSLQVSGKVLRRSSYRIVMVAICFGLVFTGLGMRLMSVSLSDMGARKTIFAGHNKAELRPEIMDRNGVLLATNLPTTALEIAGNEVWDASEAAKGIAQVVKDVDEKALELKLSRKLYVEVRSNLTPEEKTAVFELGVPGVRFSKREHRYYPQGNLATHLIGLVEKGQSTKGVGGLMGLEKTLDRVNDQGPLTSSIDIRAQQALEEVLSEKVSEFSAEAGWGGVIDVHTGEMIAMASFPEFDLNNPAAFSDADRLNRMTFDRYELGSAFKTITAASIIEAGLGDEDSLYDARKPIKIAGTTIKDYHGKNKILTLSQVVQHSSNIGAALMAQQLGVERQKAYLSKLGFLDRLPIELAENRSPDFPKRWGPVESATISYGHGIAVTPLHLLAGFSAVVNDGVYRVPTFLKVEQNSKRDGVQVFSPQTISKMRRVMRRTVMEGTGGSSEVKGYYPIGKTATADKVARTGGYLKNARISSFVGAFPGYDPQYAILISLDNPQPTKDTYGYATAGWTAAPAFQKLVTRLGPILNVPIIDKASALRQFMTEPVDYNVMAENKNEAENGDLIEAAIVKALASTNDREQEGETLTPRPVVNVQEKGLIIPSVENVMRTQKVNVGEE